ncbi:DUF429 domain-containing protein [Bradyrhizobium sp. CCBAU 051011]|uniref:DUF429 domain-containing protein n=1 Tax=Bradyrhizobium sp. CCBAU 051011 TaxID=858422 RepID=UPI0013796B43|nr:DUF429 domain-containing protein [Bradyrhizobium sp. CCBAU 051011]
MNSSFVRLIHADWSTTAVKRWAAEARRTATDWTVDAPRPVGSVEGFLKDLLREPQSTLAGFDFPIGLPSVFGGRTEFGGFCQAIDAFGVGPWSRFYDVAERAQEISLHRPFYPRVASSSVRQIHLIEALAVQKIDALRRQCEKATPNRPAACPLFWTLGSNQVGKAAISGWLEIIQPARRAGALLWPFDGMLTELSEAGRLVICETYPAEAYGHVGVRFPPGGSKRRHEDRRKATEGLDQRCEMHGIQLTSAMHDALTAGFGPGKDGEDKFDAAIGLLGMIEVVEGRRRAAPAGTNGWEGWILGQAEATQ